VWLGIEGTDFRGFGLRGVHVHRVIPGGPAAQAGLRGARDPAPQVVRQLGIAWTGYVILAVDNQPVSGFSDLTRALARRRPGQRARLRLAVPPGSLTGDAIVELAPPP
jgi:S1-C subfamily serine protease